MGAEAVTEALQTLLNRNNQTDAHLLSTGQSVSYNADLLNGLVTRVNILEAAGSSSSLKMDEFEVAQQRAQDGNVNDRLQLEKLFNQVDASDKAADLKLRLEIDAMVSELDTGLIAIAKRMDDIEAVAKMSTGASPSSASFTPTPPPGLDIITNRLDAICAEIVGVKAEVTTNQGVIEQMQ